MVTTVRAAISAVLLAGFYVLAFGVVAGLGWVAVWMWRAHPGAAAGKLSLVVLALAGGVLVALWKVIRTRPQLPDGVVVDERQAPELWATVRELAGVVQTRTPDEIRLVAEVNAAVTEDSRLLGLRAGRRYLYIGVPLLQAFTVEQLRAVLAHELGHYSHSHTRLGALTYRGKSAIVQTIVQVGPKTIAGRLFRLYARLYFLVSLAVSRRMELEADRAAVRVAGRDAAAGALRELPVISAAWGFYLNNYVGWGLESGRAPADVLGGFGLMLAARGAELEKLRAEAPEEEERSRWDSHPPIGVRVAMIEREPYAAGTGDRRPAAALVPVLPGLLGPIEQTMFDFGDRTRVPFEAYSANAMQAACQQEADALYRAAARVVDVPRADLGTVLSLLEAGRAAEVARKLRPGHLADPQADGAALASALDNAVSAAMVTAGAASWRHSWSGPVALVRSDGAPIDLEPLVRAALAQDDVRRQLAELGVDRSAAVAQETAATARGADVVAAIANLKVDGARHDVLVLDSGLLLVPAPKKEDGDKAKRRLYALATETTPQELAGRAGNSFLAYEEMSTARLAKRLPVTFEVTMRDGRVTTLRQTLDCEELGEGFTVLGQVLHGIGESSENVGTVAAGS